MKPPTLAEVQTVVRAWLAANHPAAVHVTLTSWTEDGSGEDIETVLDPPEGVPWFTNDLEHPPEVLAERRAAIVEKYIDLGALFLPAVEGGAV